MKIYAFMVPLLATVLGACGPGTVVRRPHPNERTAAAVIAVVTHGLDRLREGDPSGITSACAEDVTYYSVEQDSLLVGRQALEEMYGPATGKTSYDHFELINPKVKLYGDVAVLAFDFASYTTADDSELRTRWRSTQVLTRGGSSWKIVHIHWTLLENRLK